MPDVIYEVVEHDGGWAYKVGDVFSETFASHEEAAIAAKQAADAQEVPGESETIEYQDEKGRWHTEDEAGNDRPDTEVEDPAA